jgi:hypothetical protein
MERIDVTLTLNLPQDLAEQAKSAGLLTTKQIEQLLVEELERQRRLDRFFGKLDRLAAAAAAYGLTEADIEEEIAAFKTEAKTKRLAENR